MLSVKDVVESAILFGFCISHTCPKIAKAFGLLLPERRIGVVSQIRILVDQSVRFWNQIARYRRMGVLTMGIEAASACWCSGSVLAMLDLRMP
jgi:hypothetical protein